VNRRKPFVLVVEDDEVVCEALRGLLSDDFDAVCVGTLASARRLLDGGTCDLLVLDLMLGDGDGADLLAERRSRGPRAIVVSAKHDADRVAKKHGAAFVRKPFTDADLVATIHACLSRR
jgi:DNA-binding response OmpR family regulator